MKSFRQRLPQLDRLIAFEAAARLASFTRAAEELHLTQSAVSQQIRALESEMNVTLFQRGRRSIRLTERGEAFHNSVAAALAHLANGASELRDHELAPRLTVATDNSIAGLWLSERLPRFIAAHPDVSLRLLTTDSFTDWFAGAADLAIVLGDGQFDGALADRLFDEEVFAVCAPDFLASRPLAELSEFSDAPLLDVEFERWDWMNWTAWLGEHGAPPPARPRRLRATNYQHVVSAAKQGLGVALGWRRLIDADLLSGALVRTPTPEISTGRGYYMLSRAGRAVTPPARAFAEWLRIERDAQTLAP